MKFSNGLDDLWLRVWANRHIGVTVPHPPATPELNWVLWPRPKMADAPVPQIPDGLPGRWVPANGASSHVATFLGDVTVLRLARTEFGRTGLAREAAVLRHGTALMPRLVAEGENWLVTERLAGVRPSKPGAWVESLALFVRTFLDPLPASLAGSLSWREPLDVAPLVAVAGVDVVDAIQSSACPGEATRPTHGDLHAGNVLVNAAGELVGVLDFETVALAPPECDVAKWLTVLSAQSGIDAARTATRLAYPLGIDCRVLHDELLRELVIAASTALSREEPAPYCATVRFLAESLAEDATLPARLLGQ